MKKANKGSFVKGDPRAGRPKGSGGKIPLELKQMIENALLAVGGETYLTRQAKKNPNAFLALIGKTLPKDLNIRTGLSLEVNLVGVDRSTRG